MYIFCNDDHSNHLYKLCWEESFLGSTSEGPSRCGSRQCMDHWFLYEKVQWALFLWYFYIVMSHKSKAFSMSASFQHITQMLSHKNMSEDMLEMQTHIKLMLLHDMHPWWHSVVRQVSNFRISDNKPFFFRQTCWKPVWKLGVISSLIMGA